ncbi:MAG TPA: SDR family oxidoreductase [Acidimicrobiales bacterium]|nr:SDR family oxidoreductase [Acidimicrobiales bacterium]
MADRVVVITGGSAGVGRATAQAFAKQGATVAVLARDPDRLEETAKEIESLGGRGMAVPVDMADAAGVDDAAERVEREAGPIDVWVNNAMTSVFARFLDVTPEEFQRVTEVTYLGYVYGTRAALTRMVPRNRGVVIQVGSALAYRGIPLQAAYCGAKHAIQGFTESVRTELLHEGSAVELCQVHLPAVNTPQFDWVLSRLPRRAQPVPPIYQPELAADAVAFVAEHPTRELWVGGTTVATLAANKVMPGVLDHYLARTGVDGQQTDEPTDPDRPSNLWSPVPGPFGAHGAFDDEATSTSPTLALTKLKHRATSALRRARG